MYKVQAATGSFYIYVYIGLTSSEIVNLKTCDEKQRRNGKCWETKFYQRPRKREGSFPEDIAT